MGEQVAAASAAHISGGFLCRWLGSSLGVCPWRSKPEANCNYLQFSDVVASSCFQNRKDFP